MTSMVRYNFFLLDINKDPASYSNEAGDFWLYEVIRKFNNKTKRGGEKEYYCFLFQDKVTKDKYHVAYDPKAKCWCAASQSIEDLSFRLDLYHYKGIILDNPDSPPKKKDL